ncbi:MAG: hypothetical protein HC890_07170 [Chloroflexaceae bacterium]|nr:hypothetical protein [Chloroflexaceae bacterium]
MSITVTGRIEYQNLGAGAWAIAAEDGQIYELKEAPESLRQARGQVKVKGHIREDALSFAMIGPILEVESFEVLS